MLLLLVMLLPTASWASVCLKTGLVLECKNMSLDEVATNYNDEELLKLSNVSGGVSWNISEFAPVNTVLADHVDITVEALKDLLKMPHLSTLEVEWSNLEIPSSPDSSTLFTSNTLRRLRLSRCLKHPQPAFTFTYLSELDLSCNNLQSVPRIEGEKIVYLNLSNTQIRLVHNLDKVPSLEELDLTDNGLRSVEDDAFVFNEDLTNLWLQRNNLKAIHFNASRLQVLNLNYNNMDIIRGEYFAGVPSLTTLYLVDNGISRMEDPFKHIKHLKVLDLSNNELRALESSWFSSTPELEVLKISHNNLVELPTMFEPLHSLHHLNVSGNALALLHHDFFDQTPALAILDASDNQLVSIDGAMPLLKSLNKLHVAHNFLKINENTFAAAEQLNFLDASNNNLQITLTVFEKNKKLRDLDLSHNAIRELCVGAAAPLQILNLDISNNLVRSLQCLTELDSLNVTGNPLECNLSLQAKLERLFNSSALVTLQSSDVVEEVKIVPASNTQGVMKRKSEDWEGFYKALCPDGPAPIVATPTEETQAHSTHDEKDNNSVSDLPDKSESELPTDLASSSDTSVYEEDDDDGDEEDDDDGEDEDDEEEEVQSERASIHAIENIMRIKDSDLSFRPWATWAFILLGVCLLLLFVNLFMFVLYRRRARVDARLGSDRPYEQLHNEVYKDTTTTRADGGLRSANLTRVISTFKNEKLGEILVKFGFRTNVAGDSESQARMISGNQLA